MTDIPQHFPFLDHWGSSWVDDTNWRMAMDLLQCAVESGAISADRVTEALGTGTAADAVRGHQHGNPAVAAIRTAGTAGLAKEIAKICGKAGAAGAIVDGAVGGLQAANYIREGVIDTTQAAKHVGAEAGCGFITSSSGTAGTLAVFMLTGSMGPASLAAGMGASMGSRYLYRQVIGETLPDEEELAEEVREQAEADDLEADATTSESSDTGRAETSHGSADTDPDPREWLEEIGPDHGDEDDADEASTTDNGPEANDEDPFEEIGPGDA